MRRLILHLSGRYRQCVLCGSATVSLITVLAGRVFAGEAPSVVSFVHLLDKAGQIGGRPVDKTMIYCANDGFFQFATLKGDDVQSIASANVSASALLASAQAAFLSAKRMSKSHGPKQEAEPKRMTEAYPASLELRFLADDGIWHHWLGKADDIPEHLGQVINECKSVAEKHPQTSTSNAVFCSATSLSAHAVEQYRKDGILVELSEEHLHSNPVLSRCLTFPYRLFPVPDGESPFSPFRTTFQPGRDAMNFWYHGQGYQVRVYN